MTQLAVIFDVDGVLVDSYAAHFESWLALAKESGFEFTEPQFAVSFGRTSRDIIAQLWGEGRSDEELARMDARKEALYREIIARDFPAMDGARELIAALKSAGFKLAVGSSGPPENIALALSGLGCREAFDATIHGMQVQRGKPDPQVFLLASQALNVPPERCAVVEDAPAGVEAARRAGMAAIALTGTAPRPQLARAHRIVDSLRELSPEGIADVIAHHADK